MASLIETPSGSRIRIAFFGMRNAGKSTLVNAFCGQDVAIVSDVPGTTTDPVSKAMEILPLGPCMITDTAGLDDVGELGVERVRRTMAVLAVTDIAVWVWGAENELAERGGGKVNGMEFNLFVSECKRRGVVVVEYRRGEDVDELKRKIVALGAEVEKTPGLLDGLVEHGDSVICVCPIDESAPKGRIILPQVQVIRECLDRHISCTVVQPSELAENLGLRIGNVEAGRVLIVTDSQAFEEVQAIVDSRFSVSNSRFSLTSFSILFARQKGDLDAFEAGLAAIGTLKDGDTVLIAEGCTHHRQCNDIGTVKIPKALERLSGRKLKFVFTSGNAFNFQSADNPHLPSLIVHCGGCMLTRREVMRRIAGAREFNIPIVNYGMIFFTLLSHRDAKI